MKLNIMIAARNGAPRASRRGDFGGQMCPHLTSICAQPGFPRTDARYRLRIPAALVFLSPSAGFTTLNPATGSFCERAAGRPSVAFPPTTPLARSTG